MTWRDGVAAAVAILIAPVVVWFYVNLLLIPFEGAALWTDTLVASSIFLTTWPFAAGTMFVFGLPLLVYLTKTERTGPLPIVLGGALAGAAAYFALNCTLALFARGTVFTLEMACMYSLGALTGAHCGLAYHLVAPRRGRAPLLSERSLESS